MAERRLELYRFGGMTLDLARGSLRNGSGDVRLRPKSFDLLIYFVTNAGRLLSKDELLEAVWPGVFVTEDSLVQRVKEIRRALGDGEQVLIKTIPGRGYIFDLPVTVQPAGVAPTGSAPMPGLLGRIGTFDWRIAAAAAVVLLLSVGLGGWLITQRLPVAATAPPRFSIVVLPFANLSGDPEQESFNDALTANLTTDISRILISRIHGSVVIARNTAFTYKGKAVDEREIGRDLGVRYVLQGSAQQSPTQVRVNAQLTDAQTGSQLWAESFDRAHGDLFAIADEVAKRIANSVKFQLDVIEAERGTSADATDYITQANALWKRGPSKDNYHAIGELFEKALQLEGQNFRALAGLADALSSGVLDRYSDTREDDLRRANELVSRALAIDPDYYFAHHVRGNILRAEKRYDEAIAEYETELVLNPLSVSGLSHLARAKILVGEPAEAIPLLDQAMRISPFDPNIGYIQYRLGLANLLVGNTDEAIRWSEKAVLTYILPADAYWNLAAALALKGDKTAAQAALAEAIKRQPDCTTIAKVKDVYLLNRPKFAALVDRTVIEGLRKAGLPE